MIVIFSPRQHEEHGKARPLFGKEGSATWRPRAHNFNNPTPLAMNLQRDRSAWLQGPAHHCQSLPTHVAHPRRIVLLGAPGVGKGTQAALLSAAFGACHLSTGDIFRAARTLEASTLSPAMREAVSRMQRGELVADHTVLSIVHERLQCLQCRGGFLLDGFPRTVPQATALDALLREGCLSIDAVISYELPEAEIVARIGGRRTCPVCKSVYHAELRPPKVSGRCDACSATLVFRDDDQPQAVHVRQQAYLASTAPLLAYYAGRNLLLHVDAAGTPEDVFARTLSALNARLTP